MNKEEFLQERYKADGTLDNPLGTLWDLIAALEARILFLEDAVLPE